MYHGTKSDYRLCGRIPSQRSQGCPPQRSLGSSSQHDDPGIPFFRKPASRTSGKPTLRSCGRSFHGAGAGRGAAGSPQPGTAMEQPEAHSRRSRRPQWRPSLSKASAFAGQWREPRWPQQQSAPQEQPQSCSGRQRWPQQRPQSRPQSQPQAHVGGSAHRTSSLAGGFTGIFAAAAAAAAAAAGS